MHYACRPGTLVGRPRTVDDVVALVESADRVAPAGIGHSWTSGLSCPETVPGGSSDGSSPSSSAVGVVVTTTEFASLERFYGTGPGPRRGVDPPSAWRPAVVVDEEAATVEVDAGLTVRGLLEALARPTAQSPGGWTLAAFPWYVDQTIGGAVATGTHGSSLRHGSLSSQTIAVEAVTVAADGTGSARWYDAASDPHLFAALRLSVGRLGVVTRLRLRIARGAAVVRHLETLSLTAFAAQVRQATDALAAARATDDARLAAAALDTLHETNAFWYPPLDLVRRVDFDREDELGPGAETIAAALAGGDDSHVADADGDGGPLTFAGAWATGAPVDGLTTGLLDALVSADPLGWDGRDAVVKADPADFPPSARQRPPPATQPSPLGPVAVALAARRGEDPAAPHRAAPADPLGPNDLIAALGARRAAAFVDDQLVSTHLAPGRFPSGGRSAAYLSMAEDWSTNSARMGAYDQYEVAVPLDRAAQCLERLRTLAVGRADEGGVGAAAWTTTPFLLRFVGAEPDVPLSPTRAGARMCECGWDFFCSLQYVPPSICSTVHPSIHPSIHRSIHPSIHSSIHPPATGPLFQT